MDIRYHKNFTKAFLKLSPKIQDKIEETISVFQKNPHEPQLNNHALHGRQKGLRAISVSGDLRIIFVEENNYEIVEILHAGTHTQVYKSFFFM